MIRVNLLPAEERIPEPKITVQVPRAKIWVTVIAALAVLAPIAGVHLMQRVKIASIRADIQAAEVEHRRLKPQIERIDQLMAQREQLNQRLAVIQGLTRDRFFTVALMDELANLVPNYLWFTKVAEVQRGKVELVGRTFSNLMVAELMRRMEESEMFGDVAIVLSEKVDGRGAEDGPPVLEFTISATVQP